MNQQHTNPEFNKKKTHMLPNPENSITSTSHRISIGRASNSIRLEIGMKPNREQIFKNLRRGVEFFVIPIGICEECEIPWLFLSQNEVILKRIKITISMCNNLHPLLQLHLLVTLKFPPLAKSCGSPKRSSQGFHLPVL